MAHVILDFPGAARLRFSRPRRIVEAWHLRDVAAGLRAVEAATAAGAWAAGFVAYDAAPAFDAALATRPPAGPTPLLWFGLFDGPDGTGPEHGPEPGPGGGRADKPAARWAAGPGGSRVADADASCAGLRWRADTGRDRYDAAIGEIRRRIAAGDVYQVNHTLRFGACCDTDPGTLYDALVGGRHGRYHALVESDDWAVVSASPELFFELRGRTVTTRPMKGTVRRGAWLDPDRAAAAALADSAKDRAENLMIVDLLRNDLGRVAAFGTVRVPRLFEVETYPTVHQLTSTVTADLRDDATLYDIFAAAFPCGSVTGAPKVTAMRAIAELEDAPRGVYCGAVGVVRGDGSATFNVAIRTVTVDRRTGRAVYGAGGGITWDSRADAEYDELVAKAALLTEALPPFALLETMRMDDGVIPRRQRHLRRLQDSATYWDFDDATAARAAAALDRVAAEYPAGSLRLRLTAERDGTVSITHEPLLEPARSLAAADTASTGGTAPLTCAIARRAVSATSRLLYHNTTARALYDAHHADFPHAFDVLLYNEEGMATEFTRGNIVALIDGRLVTPPRHHGLLAGTFRDALLAAGTVVEAPLPLADVRRAERLYHVNSVRGATRVVAV